MLCAIIEAWGPRLLWFSCLSKALYLRRNVEPSHRSQTTRCLMIKDKVPTWVSRLVRTRNFVFGAVSMFAVSIMAFLAETWQADNDIEGTAKCPVSGLDEVRHSTATRIETTYSPPQITCFQDGYPPMHLNTFASSITYYSAFILIAVAFVIFIVKMARFFGWFSRKRT